MSLVKEIVGEAYSMIECAKEIIEEFDGVEYFLPSNDKFKTMLKNNPNKMGKYYWSEKLERSHFSAIASLKRIIKWFQMIDKSEDNFILFCSAFRGLIENIGDTYSALDKLPATLGQNRQCIINSMKGNSMAICQDLENLIENFIYASKQISQIVKNSNKNNTIYDPLSSAKYVKILEIDSKIKYYELYKYLCEMVHPAAPSMTYSFIDKGEDMIQFDYQKDIRLVKEMSFKNKDVFVELIMKGMNPIFLLFGVINMFGIQKLYSNVVSKMDLSYMPAWEKIIKNQCKILK